MVYSKIFHNCSLYIEVQDLGLLISSLSQAARLLKASGLANYYMLAKNFTEVGHENRTGQNVNMSMYFQPYIKTYIKLLKRDRQHVDNLSWGDGSSDINVPSRSRMK